MKTLYCSICLMLLLALSSSSQIIDVKEKIKNKSIDRADQRTDEGIDNGLDKAEEGIKKIFSKDKKNRADQENADENDDEQVSDENESKKDSNSKKSEKLSRPTKLESNTKYDFIPGDKVLFFEDFSKDAVGDFPALWTTNGSGEVRTLKNYPGNWLYMNSESNAYALMKNLSLPDNFIIEFDIVPTPVEEGGERSGCYLSLYNGEGEFLDDAIYPGKDGVNITLTEGSWEIVGYQDGGDQMQNGQSTLAPVEINKSNHVIVWIQKRRIRIYHKEQKVLDLPSVLFPQVKYNRLRFSLWGNEGFQFVTNIRITSAAPDMRNKLLTEGKIVSYGIYFDVGKAVLKPESYGTLKEIANVLTENPDLKIKIVGHTDSDGNDATNIDLSKNRAASVKNELVKTFAINASRIETDGKGKNEPIAPNDSPSNKALNRRVEFIKQ